jgi:hypothetical protein
LKPRERKANAERRTQNEELRKENELRSDWFWRSGKCLIAEFFILGLAFGLRFFFNLLPSAFSLLPSAFSLQPSAFCLQPSAFAFSLLPSAFCFGFLDSTLNL